jgi:hypothetical protein
MNIIGFKHISSKFVMDRCPICGLELEILAWDNFEKKKACEKCCIVYDFEEAFPQ